MILVLGSISVQSLEQTTNDSHLISLIIPLKGKRMISSENIAPIHLICLTHGTKLRLRSYEIEAMMKK